jgi:hypothetical protein
MSYREEERKLQAKSLEENSRWDEADADGDGIITDEEMAMYERKVRFENEDKKEDAQRNMAWFALAGMLLYPFAVVLAVGLGLSEAGKILGSMASVYFVSVAAIVAAFYGGQAYSKGKK